MLTSRSPWNVVDLFSGAGGMSFGFTQIPAFQVVAAVDAEVGKPSSGQRSLDCNSTYEANIGIKPLPRDLAELTPEELVSLVPALAADEVHVLISCAPCTGFSRTNSNNHIVDDRRNSLVTRMGGFVRQLRPAIFLMENARELVSGNFAHHFSQLSAELSELGYRVHGRTHFLNEFGLPQRRERALIVAVRSDVPLHTLDELWDGFSVRQEATHVRHAIADLPPVEAGEAHQCDALHVSPRSNELGLRRLRAIPHDGGSWADLRLHPDSSLLMTPAMKRYVERGDFGSHPDVYGRLWWDRPAVTIKRECGHTGNGRYAHPEQDRLCTVREMSILQGFPRDYQFVAGSLSNMYRHIGDAVPPLISYQLARLCEWILTDQKPEIHDIILPGTHLTPADLEEAPDRQLPLPLTPTPTK